jgi:two-component system, NarL family, response regulator LiaR
MDAPNDGMFRVLLAFEHRIYRYGLRALLERTGRMEVVGEVSTGSDAYEETRRLLPDLTVLDSWLERLPAIEVTRRIAQDGLGSKVLILSTRGPRQPIEELIRAGASAYLSAESAPDELLAAIDALRDGQHYVSPAATRHLFDALAEPRGGPRAGRGRLTGREREVLQLIAEGLSSKEIAMQLALAVRTVESHRAHLMEKLEVNKVSGLVRVAIRQGLVAP